MSNPKFFITKIQCVNICSQVPVKPIAKTHGENLMVKFIKAGYFYEDNDDYYFGPKFVAEFSSFILENFPDDIHSCCLCKNLVFTVG